MNHYEMMSAESGRLASNIATIEKMLCALPEGTLRYWKTGDGYKHFVVKNGKRAYISTKDQELVAQLAKKKILTKMLQDAKAEKAAIDSYLNNHCEIDHVAECLANEPYLEQLVRPLYQARDNRLRAWAEEKYPSTAGFPEKLVHPGPGCKMYRSKSEAMIAHTLYKKGIPFRYEWDHEINGIVYHIDFTIRHPKTGETFYWEHFGKMNDERYVYRNMRKLIDFESAGIFPGVNLILTYESGKFPLNIGKVEEIVERWFCQDA